MSGLGEASFGSRYHLIRRLAVGGMAEIYLARQDAMAGFEKEVVIKRLRGELADDPRIVEMFLDEARIGALLNHPNIVHVYDVDEHDGIPYIAMEYIVGEELNELCRRGLTHGRFLPLEHAVELIRQASAGMGYFHAKRGGEGSAFVDQALDIVHCDISPSNLLVTEDGFLKVIDFGIAKSQFQRQRAEGVIPGKLSYMSPEQASRKAVDHRSDIYSLGIVLYEITVGRRLFKGSAQEVVKRLTEGEIEPPTFSRRNFPPQLEAIVMRALERHPDDRYQTAYDLADDLETFLRDTRMHSGPVRIARYLDQLTEADGGVRRRELISEAEQRRGDDELDFDSQVFDGYAPSEGAPGPETAPEWEDIEEPEAEVAAALGLELAELRSLRTPVPLRSIPPIPAGVRGPGGPEGPGRRPADAAGADPELGADHPEHDVALGDGPALGSDPVHSVHAGAVAALSAVAAAPDPVAEDDVVEEEAAAPLVAPVAAAVLAVGAAGAGLVSGPPADLAAERRLTSDRRQAPVVSAIGASYLARSEASKLPWVLVATLAVAVASLLAYIVMK